MEVKSIGQNTVSWKNYQYNVTGPDNAHAQSIAKQLSTRAANLGELNGKKVLIYPVINQEQQQSAQKIAQKTSQETLQVALAKFTHFE